MKNRIFISLILLGFFVLSPLVSEGSPPTRTDVYVSGQTADPAAVTRNEDAIFTYLQAGVDTLANNSVTSLKIVDGTIANADISSSAAIVGSKLDLSVPGAIGGTTPANGTFTTLIGTNVDGIVGANTAAAATVTTLEATGLITATGGQIKFPSSQSASADPNTLDDYEEGFHTATVTCTVSGSYTVDANLNKFAYTKIGGVVFVQGLIQITGENAPDGQLKVSLPFVSATLEQDSGLLIGVGYVENHGGTITGNQNARIANGQAFCRFNILNDNGIVNVVSDTDVDTIFGIWVSVRYRTE